MGIFLKNCSLSVDEAAEEDIGRAEVEHEQDVTHTDGHHERVPSLNNHQGIGYRVGLSEIGAEGQKVQKSKLVTFFLL